MDKKIDFSHYPILNLESRQGNTDYIDFLRWNEVSYPVMVGLDKFKRKFMVIKFWINNKQIMQTFFQRYTDGNCWMGCGHATTNLLETSGSMNDKQIELLKKLLNYETVELEEHHRPCSQSFLGKKVQILNIDNLIKNAKIIQKNWKICRYNPSYKMCQKILLQMNTN